MLLGCGKFQTEIKWNQLEMDSAITLMWFSSSTAAGMEHVFFSSATHQICTSVM